MLDRIPASSLTTRYGVGRTTLHERVKALNLSPEKEGNRAFFSADQVAVLDALAEHIKAGGSTPDFVRSFRPEQSELSTVQPSAFAPNAEQPEHSERWLQILELLAFRLSPPPVPDPLRLHRQLEEITSNGWIVTTPQLRAVMGHNPVEGSRYGFCFVKVGRQGLAMGWQIQKASAALP